MNRSILITLKKELRSMFRDRKTMMMMLLFPLFIPAMICLYGFIYDSIDNGEKNFNIMVNYNIDDNTKVIFDEMHINYELVNTKEEMESKYDEGEYDGYIVYTTDNNTYTIYSNQSNTDGLTFNEIMYSYFDSYNKSLTDAYLINNGINLEEAYNHFNVESVSLSENNYMLTMVLSVCFMYIIMAICTATSNMAIATTAQEKENGTLETILTFPVKKSDLIIGKYLSSVVLGFLSSLIALFLTVAGIYFGSKYFKSFSDFGFDINVINILFGIVVIFLASLFIAGFALVLTSKTKSFKEAQSKVAMMNLLTLIPFYFSLMGVSVSDSYYLIPICNFEQLLMDIFVSGVSNMHILYAVVSTFVVIFVVVKYIITAYNSESVLFKD